jgi:dihydrofolate reductase
MRLPAVSMIAAMTLTGVIGRKGTMPWRLPRDVARFVKLTRRNTVAVVMGPKTYASIGKPLKGRLNIVITTNHAYQAPEGVLVAHDPRQALELAAINNCVEFFVIGGAMVYTSFLPYAEHLFITYVKSNLSGDTKFPHWRPKEWHEVWIEKDYRKEKGDSFPTRFAEYRRNLPPLPADTQAIWRLPGDEKAQKPKKKRGRKKRPRR